MTGYKHFPYQSWIKWIIKPRQSHMIDALERRPDSFRGVKGRELQERLSMMERWLKVRAVLIVLLSFSVIVTAVSWVLRLIGGVPGGGAVMAIVEAISNVSSTTSGALGLLYVLTLRTLGQLEMDAILLLPSHRSHWASGETEPAGRPEHRAAPEERSRHGTFRSAPKRTGH